MADVVRTRTFTSFDTYEQEKLVHHEVEGKKELAWIADNYGRFYNPAYGKKMWSMDIEHFKEEAYESSGIVKKIPGYDLPQWIKDLQCTSITNSDQRKEGV